MKEKLKSRYVKLSMALFITGAALILVSTIVNNMEGFSEELSKVNNILEPFVFGFVMAYLISPIYNLIVRKTYHLTGKSFEKKKRALAFSKVVATIISLVILIGFVGGLLWLVLPELVRSIVGIIEDLPRRMNDFVEWVQTTVASVKYPHATEVLENAISRANKSISDWAQNEFLPSIGTYMGRISQGVILTLRTMFNLAIGLIVCVYVLNSKEVFKAQCKKFIAANFNREKSDGIMEFTYYTNRTFGGFINGKIIDSIIIGILCFILMTLIGLPYVMLISTIVGVTNFIPFFGPFIGAIPSTIIILLVDPLQALYFLIMVFLLQQLDGNVIGPKILGGTTGLASFWVLFAIMIGGGLFGFVGMIVGVPAFAVVYHYTGRSVKRRLEKKKLPAETEDYMDFNQYDIDRRDVL